MTGHLNWKKFRDVQESVSNCPKLFYVDLKLLVHEYKHIKGEDNVVADAFLGSVTTIQWMERQAQKKLTAFLMAGDSIRSNAPTYESSLIAIVSLSQQSHLLIQAFELR